MTRIEQIGKDIQHLSAQEPADFRRWFSGFDATVSNARIEANAAAGKFDEITRQALQAHAAGRSDKL